MDDLFGYRDEDPRPSWKASTLGLQPWPNCDTYSEAWRAYCEAAEHVRGSVARTSSSVLRGVEKKRGLQGRLFLEGCIALVKRDLAGEVHPRDQIPAMFERIRDDLHAADMKAALARKRSGGKR
jgi:hypothetical protein